MGLFSNLFGAKKIDSVRRDKNGVWSFWMNESAFGNDRKYLEWSLTNPVLMTVISIRAKLYSQMKITHYKSNGDEIENSPYLKLLHKPNYFQSQEDWLFQQMWFMSVDGKNLIYQPKSLTSQLPSSLYNLIPTEIDLEAKRPMRISDFVLTTKDEKAFSDRTFDYTLGDKTHNIPFKSVIPLYDLSNALTCDSWMDAPSRINGIKCVLQNIDENIKSKNINLKMSQKYLFKNETNPEGQPQIQDTDRNAIENVLGKKAVMITNASISANHLVSDFKKLFLDEMFSNDATTVLNAFEMNRDVLNYFSNGASTHDNQEQGIIRYVQSCTQVDANNLMSSLMQEWGLYDTGEKLVASYNHLPVMQIVMKVKIDTFKAYQETLKLAIENQTIDAKEAKEMSDKLKNDLGL